MAVDAADGSRVLLRAGADGFEVLWRGEELSGTDALDTQSARTSANGRHVLALGGTVADASGWLRRTELRRLRPRPADVVLAAGAITSDGFEILYLDALADVSDAGAALLRATVRPLGETTEPTAAVVVADAAAVRVVAAPSDLLPVHRRFIGLSPLGLTDAGGVVFAGTERDAKQPISGIYRADGERVTGIVTTDATIDGQRIVSLEGIDAAPNGDVLFRAWLDGGSSAIYRTGNGAVRAVVRADDLNGGFVSGAQLNSAGDVAFVVQRGELPFLKQFYEVHLLRASGERDVHPIAPVRAIALNEGGSIAYLGEDGIVRRSARGQRLVLGVGDRLGDGTPLLSGGLEAICLADDGRVAMLAHAQDGLDGWLCADGEGTHLVGAAYVQERDARTPRPRCAFGGDRLYVLRNGAIEALLQERTFEVLAPGMPADVLSGSPPIRYIAGFTAGADGTVLAVVATDDAELLVRVPRGGFSEHIDLTPPGSEGVSVGALGLTTDGAAAALVYPHLVDPSEASEARTAVVVSDARGVRVLWQSDPGQAVYAQFRGDLALLTVDQGGLQIPSYGYFLLDLQTGELRDVPFDFLDPDASASPYALQADGDLLMAEYAVGRTRHWLVEDGEPTLLTDVPSAFAPPLRPLDLGAGGHLLLTRPIVPLQLGEHELSLAGPAVTAGCPRGAPAGDAPLTADHDGCQVGGAAGTSAWPLLIAAALLAARQFRRR